MQHEISCDWEGDGTFTADVMGHMLTIDAGDKGPSPKPLVLAAVAGCTGIDVAGMLEKMRVPLEGLHIRVNGELTEEEPKYYRKIHLIYEVRGRDLPRDKVERAVRLSREKYCGVSAQLEPKAEISHEIRYL